jgi:hypothetical protein
MQASIKEVLAPIGQRIKSVHSGIYAEDGAESLVTQRDAIHREFGHDLAVIESQVQVGDVTICKRCGCFHIKSGNFSCSNCSVVIR